MVVGDSVAAAMAAGLTDVGRDPRRRGVEQRSGRVRGDPRRPAVGLDGSLGRRGRLPALAAELGRRRAAVGRRPRGRPRRGVGRLGPGAPRRRGDPRTGRPPMGPVRPRRIRRRGRRPRGHRHARRDRDPAVHGVSGRPCARRHGRRAPGVRGRSAAPPHRAAPPSARDPSERPDLRPVRRPVPRRAVRGAHHRRRSSSAPTACTSAMPAPRGGPPPTPPRSSAPSSERAHPSACRTCRRVWSSNDRLHRHDADWDTRPVSRRSPGGGARPVPPIERALIDRASAHIDRSCGRIQAVSATAAASAGFDDETDRRPGVAAVRWRPCVGFAGPATSGSDGRDSRCRSQRSASLRNGSGVPDAQWRACGTQECARSLGGVVPECQAHADVRVALENGGGRDER